MNRMHVIYTDGAEKTIEIPDHVANDPAALGNAIREQLNGYMEIAPFFDRFRGERCVAMIDEEGKLKRLPYNRKATEHWHQLVAPRDALYGPVVILMGSNRFLTDLS